MLLKKWEIANIIVILPKIIVNISIMVIKILYKIYSFCIALPIFVVVTIITAIVISLAALLGDKDHTDYFMSKWWSRLTCRIFLLGIRVTGREKLLKSQSYIFLANHQGYFDIFLIYGYMGHNFKWMMKEYLRKIPFVGAACAISGQIFVDDSRSGIQKAVDQSRKTLQGGMSMVIFPEGTRTYNGQMGEFKRGAFMLSNEIGLPIVPMTINGSFQVFSRKARSVSQGTLSLDIHTPIFPDYYKSKPTKVFMNEVRDIINKNVR